MIPIEHIQFAAITLTGFLTLMLVFMLPLRGEGGQVYNRSRWLMVAGTALLPVQFLLQYTLHFRQMGVEPAVLVNLLFFIPCAWLLGMAILNLLRQNSLRRQDWLVGLGCYVVVVVLLLGANPTAGHGVLAVTQRLYFAEVLSAIVYAAMQFHYTVRLWQEFRRVRLAMDNYFDREHRGVIRWMRNSTMLLSLSAVFAPAVIFWSGPLLVVYTLIIFFCISYTVVCFYGYGLDRHRLHDLQQVERSLQEDEQQAAADSEAGGELSEHDMKRIAAAVDRWLARGGHLHAGITIQTATDEMHVPRYLFSAWLKTTRQGLFNPWLTYHRIEEAKQQLTLHPEWNNDAIAEHCGFNTRTYFQTTFKRLTGVTPQEFLAQQ
ncbi:MAG: helix-turn-helix domain-containing protein [Prevotella sp.]|nr:helix-turn-helix domain-containing protein [Prevotella sp.]